MASVSSNPFRESLLNAKKFREMIREAKGGFAPDHVGATLRYRNPMLLQDDANDVCDVLAKLAATARERLNDAGFEPLEDGGKAPNISKREREYVLNLAVILSWLANAQYTACSYEPACHTALEGIGWCRLAGDARQQSILWRNLVHIHQELHHYGEEEEAAIKAIETAREAGDPEELAKALHTYSVILTVRYRVDEAEQFNIEAREMLRQNRKEDANRALYAMMVMNAGRLQVYRSRFAEGLQTFREALRWADAEEDPIGRATILIHLGALYLRLHDFRQCIECQHEVIKLSEIAGSNMGRSMGYFKLADVHLRMNELDLAEEMLDRAAACIQRQALRFHLPLAAKRAEVQVRRGRDDEAAELYKWIIDQIGTHPIPDLEVSAHIGLAEIEDRRDRLEEALRHFNISLDIARRSFPEKIPTIQVSMAEAYQRHGGNDEAGVLVDEIVATGFLDLTHEVRILYLRANIAENRGDLRAALDFSREAFAAERAMLERQAEQSLRNARIVAETDLLEREADLERERRRRLERELADAVVQLGDRKRQVEHVEEKLRLALRGVQTNEEPSAMRAMRETLTELRKGSQPSSPLRYLSGVDEDFFRRLRTICPDLTPKQERLCGLLRAGLASKDISTLLNLGPEGLKAQRKRLRKKLSLHPDERLETVLSEI